MPTSELGTSKEQATRIVKKWRTTDQRDELLIHYIRLAIDDNLELAVAPPASPADDDADSLHFSICEAVALMNQNEHHAAHDLLRQKLVDYADSKRPSHPSIRERIDTIRQQQRSGGSEVTAIMVSPASPAKCEHKEGYWTCESCGLEFVPPANSSPACDARAAAREIAHQYVLKGLLTPISQVEDGIAAIIFKHCSGAQSESGRST